MSISNGFDSVTTFENSIAEYYGAPFAVAVDCCTHGLELALRDTDAKEMYVPKHTYLSVAMLAEKLNIKRSFLDDEWDDYYYISDNIVDSAVYWKKNSYIKSTYMVLSFQFKKHLSLGRGGMILVDDEETAHRLRCMAYDGRDNSKGPWASQNIETIGYHYYMTPETAEKGIYTLNDAMSRVPKKWNYKNYPNISNLKVFNNG